MAALLRRFSRRDYEAADTDFRIPVEVEASDAKFSPDPVFAALQPIPEPKKPISEPKKKTDPAKSVAHRAAPPREVHQETRDGLVSGSWKYLQEKTQAWKMRIGRLSCVS